jgi:hypothetical protein
MNVPLLRSRSLRNLSWHFELGQKPVAAPPPVIVESGSLSLSMKEFISSATRRIEVFNRVRTLSIAEERIRILTPP